MTDIRARLAEGLLADEGAWDYSRFPSRYEHADCIVASLLSLSGIAIVDLNDDDARLISGRWIDFARQNPDKAKGFATGLLWAAAAVQAQEEQK